MARRLLSGMTLLALLCLVACRDESPIVSAHVNGSPLSEQQLVALNQWFREHTSGWTLIVAPPPAPSFTVTVKQANGKTGHLDFFSRENWDKVVVFWSEDPGDNRMGSFSPLEVGNLRRELEDKR